MPRTHVCLKYLCINDTTVGLMRAVSQWKIHKHFKFVDEACVCVQTLESSLLERHYLLQQIHRHYKYHYYYPSQLPKLNLTREQYIYCYVSNRTQGLKGAGLSTKAPSVSIPPVSVHSVPRLHEQELCEVYFIFFISFSPQHVNNY